MATKPQQRLRIYFSSPMPWVDFSSVSGMRREVVISWHNIGDGGGSRFCNDHFWILVDSLVPGLLLKVSFGPCPKKFACPWPRIMAFLQEDVSEVTLWTTLLVESCRYPRDKSLSKALYVRTLECQTESNYIILIERCWFLSVKCLPKPHRVYNRVVSWHTQPQESP